MTANRIYTICTVLAAGLIIAGCGGPKRQPGRTYMPDMTYSRAYETYPDLDTNLFTSNEAGAGNKIYYDRKPVAGAVKRGQLMVYHGTNDSVGIAYSQTLANPIPDTLAANSPNKAESERLYNIYCGICHGPKLDGKGPLVASGKWAGVAANLMDLAKFGKAVYPDGQVFHTITYGKNQMGGYASQLNVKQRWMVVNFIRSKQAAVKPAAETPAAAGAAKTPATDAQAANGAVKAPDTVKTKPN